MRAAVLAFSVAAMPFGAQAQVEPVKSELTSGTEALLQAVSPVDALVVWVSGHEGAVLRSVDGGDSWQARPVQTLDSLQFRDVHGFSADRAVILSAGPGAQSRIYRTVDGGGSWSLGWVNDEPEGFYDCMDFWDDRRGVAYGDAVGGELRILLTDDGGVTWRRVAAEGRPAAVDGEGGFAASGTCVETGPDGRAWIGTGAGTRSRALRTVDYGQTWDAVDLPIVSGTAAGAFTIVFSDARFGVALGGDLGQADAFTDNVAITDDGGATWTPGERTPIPGAVYGAALARAGVDPIVVAGGPGGLVVTNDLTAGWRLIDSGSFWAVGAVGSTAWAVGPQGRIVKLVW
jgi:photosystem II stability/assembly factor-like uncharacterized protein